MKDDLTDPNIRHEYQILSCTKISELIEIIKCERNIKKDFRIFSKEDQIENELRIDHVLDRFGTIVRIKKVAENDDSDDEIFHISKKFEINKKNKKFRKE